MFILGKMVGGGVGLFRNSELSNFTQTGILKLSLLVKTIEEHIQMTKT